MTSQQQARPPVLITVAAEIDMTTCEQVHDQLSAALACGAPVVIADFTVTTFCDCATLRCLLAIQRRAAAGRTEFRIAVPLASPVRRIMRMTGLAQQLRLYPTAAHAAAAPRGPAPRILASPVRTFLKVPVEPVRRIRLCRMGDIAAGPGHRHPARGIDVTNAGDAETRSPTRSPPGHGRHRRPDRDAVLRLHRAEAPAASRRQGRQGRHAATAGHCPRRTDRAGRRRPSPRPPLRHPGRPPLTGRHAGAGQRGHQRTGP